MQDDHAARTNLCQQAGLAMSGITRLIMVVCTAMSVPAYAELGGDESGISAEAVASRMELRAVAPRATRYRVHELRDSARNISVRQYVNPGGKVFGVAWDGPTKPDLSQLLGGYFTRYMQAAAGHGMARQLRIIDQPDFALRVSGHMRHFTGSAWVPNLVPANVDPAEVK